MFRKVFTYVLGAAFLAVGVLHAQQPKVEARIAGLEGNAEYMSLLREDAQLQMREDSIVNAVERMRQRLREDPARRPGVLAGDSATGEPDLRNPQRQGTPDRPHQHHRAEWVLANLNGVAQQPWGPLRPIPRRRCPIR